MSEDRISLIFNHLSAYDWDDVKEAFKRLNQDHVRQVTEHRNNAIARMKESGWSEHVGAIPKGYEWQQIGSKIFIRDRAAAVNDPTRVTVQQNTEARKRPARKRADTSVKRVQELKCPSCGGEMFKEGICPGCDEGRRGLKVRLLCGECDYTVAL